MHTPWRTIYRAAIIMHSKQRKAKGKGWALQKGRYENIQLGIPQQTKYGTSLITVQSQSIRIKSLII